MLRQKSTTANVTCALPSKLNSCKVPLENIVATHPIELVHLNYLCLEPGKGLDENVLVVTDHFTRYAQAYVTRTQICTDYGLGPYGASLLFTMGYLREIPVGPRS